MIGCPFKQDIEMVSVVPSMSTQGWLTTTGEKADRLLGYFFSSEYSQTKSYYGRISSLPYLIAEYQSKMSDLRTAINRSLNQMMSSYFEEIDIDVRISADDESDTKYTIYLSARIIENEETFELSNVIQIEDSVIAKISKITGG